MTLFDAICQQFNSAASMVDANLTPLRTGRAGRAGDPPYAIIIPVSESRQWRSSNTVGEIQLVQFSLFTTSFTQANQFRWALRSVFPDSTSLAVSEALGSNLLQLRWTGGNVIEDDAGKSLQVWHAQNDFEAEMTYTRS